MIGLELQLPDIFAGIFIEFVGMVVMFSFKWLNHARFSSLNRQTIYVNVNDWLKEILEICPSDS